MSTIPYTALVCPQCNTQIAPTMLACPGCGRLVHADRLKELAQSADNATTAGDPAAALGFWREAIDLLPPDSRQHQAVRLRIEELVRAAPTSPAAQGADDKSKSPLAKAAGGMGAAGLVLWKLKVFLLVLLTKGKLLLLGLTKASTLFSMLLSIGVYCSLWGWRFAVGLVLSIYIHEMGHVFALRRYGFKATSPMFIPGLGAVIRLQQNVTNPHEDAVIGLAGPIYGLGAALVSLGLWRLTGNPLFAAIAGVGAWVNLFNLLPVWTLDGGRAFHALSRVQKWLAVATVGAAWFYTGDGLLVLIGAVCAWRAVTDKSEPGGNWTAATQYALLVVLLSALAMVRLHATVPAT